LALAACCAGAASAQSHAGMAFLPEPPRNYGIAAGALAVLLCAELRRRRLQASA
jgi:hypothetical protein